MKEFDKVWNFIRTNGTLVNQAKSSYGADRWEMPNGLTATLEDDGYTKGIFGTKVKVRTTYRFRGHDTTFYLGTEKELKELHKKLEN